MNNYTVKNEKLSDKFSEMKVKLCQIEQRVALPEINRRMKDNNEAEMQEREREGVVLSSCLSLTVCALFTLLQFEGG